MKERSLFAALIMALLALIIGPVAAHAQATPTDTPTSTPTPTATPTPTCPLTQLPDGEQTDCRTGGMAPPSLLGISGGNLNSLSIDKSGTVTCYTGTFGAVVQDASPSPLATPVQYVLSTNENLARSSGSKKAKVNEAIVEPGLPDLGCWQAAEDTVAELTKFTAINFKGKENQLDAAIAKIVDAKAGPVAVPTAGVDPLGRIFNIGQLSTTPLPFDSLIDGLPVMKMGRSTCITTGVIAAYDAMGQVVYPATTPGAASSGTALFDHQILVSGEDLSSKSATGCTFADKGDSGAMVMTFDFTCPQAIGMVFAGSSGAGADSGGTIVAVNPIQTILDKFKVTLVGQTCTPTPMERRINEVMGPAVMSAALRSSVEAIRRVKDHHGRRLLRKRGVVAVGIGSGDTPDTAALNVYLTEDTPKIRGRVLREVKGTNVKFKHLGAKFQAL